MKLYLNKILAGSLITLIFSGCGNLLLRLASGNGAGIQGVSPTLDGTSFADRCGFKVSDLSRPDFVLLSQRMKSLPILSTGEQQGVKYTITLNADVSINAPASGESVTETIIKVVDVQADDNGRFSRGFAEDAAHKNSSRVSSVGMGSGLLLQLSESNPEFKGILCSVGFTSRQRYETVEGESIIEFTPGIAGALNPYSSLQNFNNELGSSKTFTATAKIIKAAKDTAPVGTTAIIKTTFKKVSAKLLGTPGAPTNAPDLNANLAYEIVTVGTNGEDVTMFKLSKRRVMFLRASDKAQGANTLPGELVGVLEDGGNVDKATGIKQPVAVIIK